LGGRAYRKQLANRAISAEIAEFAFETRTRVSIMAIHWLADQPLSCTEKGVLVWLLLTMNYKGSLRGDTRCWCAKDRLQKLSSADPKTIDKVIDAAKNSGLIVPTGVGRGYHGLVPEYRVAIPMGYIEDWRERLKGGGDDTDLPLPPKSGRGRGAGQSPKFPSTSPKFDGEGDQIPPGELEVITKNEQRAAPRLASAPSQAGRASPPTPSWNGGGPLPRRWLEEAVALRKDLSREQIGRSAERFGIHYAFQQKPLSAWLLWIREERIRVSTNLSESVPTGAARESAAEAVRKRPDDVPQELLDKIDRSAASRNEASRGQASVMEARRILSESSQKKGEPAASFHDQRAVIAPEPSDH
jgi:hypothetical protein